MQIFLRFFLFIAAKLQFKAEGGKWKAKRSDMNALPKITHKSRTNNQLITHLSRTKFGSFSLLVLYTMYIIQESYVVLARKVSKSQKSQCKK